MRVFMTGGTGLIGRRLTKALLDRGDQVVVLTRRVARARSVADPRAVLVEGDPTVEGTWGESLRECDAVVNLAGENLMAHRWNESVKERIHASRYLSTFHVADAIAASGRKLSLVSASAVGYYGPREGDTPVDETTPPGDDFLAKVCIDWEHACAAAIDAGSRVVNPRIGVVLDTNGGALPRMTTPFKLFLGGPAGSGMQWVSWIHIEDLARVFLFVLDREDVRGAVNACAPNAVTMNEFARALGGALARPSWARVPERALRLALGEAADVVLTGQRVVPRRLLELGFTFEHGTIDEALRDLLASGRARAAA